MKHKGLNKGRKTTMAQAKRRANKAFSEWIRRPNLKVGSAIQCYTCGVWKEWTDMDAGHGIEGRNNAVLFIEEITKPQCKQCNIFKHGNLRIFTRKLIEELGVERYDELVALSHQTVIYRTQDYLGIETIYKEKLEELSS